MDCNLQWYIAHNLGRNQELQLFLCYEKGCVENGIHYIHDLWGGRDGVLEWSELGPDGFLKEIQITIFFSIQKQSLRHLTDRKPN